MLSHPDPVAWLTAIVRDNVLQKTSQVTARRQAGLIRRRLVMLDETAWHLVAEAEQEVAVQILLAAAVKHSRLLGDFMRNVVAGHVRRLEHTLSHSDWEAFLADCARRDAAVAQWSTGTRSKLLEVMQRILAEAHYLESTRNLRLTPPLLHPDVVRYLRARSELEVLAAMELKP